jgi:protein-L-isoaspartate(D-aspartate) O-methyltransferase
MATPEQLRARMVDRLGEYGIVDGRIRDALLRVPRHEFLEEIHDLALVHDVDKAVPITGFDPRRITTTVSAPGLVAVMLQLLELEPGHRVLEIGTGSGYNAALLAVLGCVVTTVDIDATLIEPARRRLAAVGHPDVEVVEGDGDDGFAPGAPYDRIIATVGCNDLSPAWFDQLEPDGFMVIPLKHGRLHPLVRAAGRRSRAVGRSGFVQVLGRQAELADWDVPLEDGWDAAYFAALHVLPGDAADDSTHRDLVRRWRELGSPRMDRFVSTWVPKGTGRGTWVLPRIHHDQVVELEPPPG